MRDRHSETVLQRRIDGDATHNRHTHSVFFLILSAYFITTIFIASLPTSSAMAWGVCVDSDPRAPRCDDISSGSRSGGTVPYVPIKSPRDFARDAYNICRTYFFAKKMKEAFAACQNAINLDPSFAHPYNVLAGIYNEMNDFPHAVELIRAAIGRQNHPDFFRNLTLILENWAWFALRANDLNAAESAARSILATNLEHKDALYVMGRIRERRDDLQGAIEYYERSRPPEARRLRDRLEKIKRTEEHNRRQAQIKSLRETVEIQFSNGEFKNAESTLRKLLNIDPNNENGWQWLAKILAKEGRLDDAANAYRKVGNLGAGKDWAENAIFGLYWNEAESRAKASDSLDQIAIWSDLVNRYPDKRGNYARWRLAKIYNENANFDRLITVAEDILRADPGNADALKLIDNTKTNVIRDSAKAAFADGEEDRAVAYLKQEVVKNPKSVNAAADLAYYMMQAGDSKTALDLMRTTVTNNPSNGYAHYMMAWAARASDDFDLARQHIREANRLSGGKYADFENETFGPIGTIMDGIGTLVRPVKIAEGAVKNIYQRGKPISKDWGLGIGSIAKSLFSGSNPTESINAAKAAKFYGSMAVSMGADDARKFSSLVFDSGALVPSDGLDVGQSITGSTTVSESFEQIPEDVPPPVKNSAEWTQAAKEIDRLRIEARKLDKRITQLEKDYKMAPASEQRSAVAVKVAEAKQEKSIAVAEIAHKTFIQRELVRKFHFDTTVRPQNSESGESEQKQ